MRVYYGRTSIGYYFYDKEISKNITIPITPIAIAARGDIMLPGCLT